MQRQKSAGESARTPPTDWDDLVSRDFSDPWWNKTDFIRTTDRFDVPALHINSWNDFGIGETLKLFNQMRTNADSARGRLPRGCELGGTFDRDYLNQDLGLLGVCRGLRLIDAGGRQVCLATRR